jgi:16S rRNA U1498 N3-methylase RsmE
VDGIASHIDWVVRYAADLKAMTEIDAEPITILKMMRMYVKDNDDKVDEFKKLQDMIIEAPEECKK